MSITQLYGKCRELGYCACGGKLGCTDDTRNVVKLSGNQYKPKPDKWKRKNFGMDMDTPIEKLVKNGGKI